MTTQEITLIESESKSITEQVKSLVIVDQTTYEKGASIKISLSGLRKKIKIFFDPMVDKAKASYDEIRDKRDIFLKPTVAAEDELKSKLKAYERQKEQEAEEARRKAEKERQEKIDAENKRRREEAEQKVKDEAEVMGIDEKDVKVSKVEEVKPEDVEVEQPLPTINKVTGLGIRQTWKVEVVDKALLPMDYLLPDMVALNAMAREQKEKFNIPGAKAYKD